MSERVSQTGMDALSRKVLSSWARAEGQAGPGKVSLNSHENSVPVDFILKAVRATCAGTHQ